MTQRIVRTERRLRDGDRDPHETAITEVDQAVARLNEAKAPAAWCFAPEDTPHPLEGAGRSA